MLSLRRRLSLFIVSSLIAPLAVVALGTSASAAPTNDLLSAATNVTTQVTNGDTVDAGSTGSEYTGGAGASQSSTVWFKWVPTSTAAVTVKTCGSAKSNALLVYTSSETSAGTVTPTSAPSISSSSSGCTNGQTVSVTPANTTDAYYIKVATKNGANEGSVKLTITDAGLTSPTTITALAKVTICHRTHSTTNPYVIINVSTSSIVKADSTSNGHGFHNSDKSHTDKGIFNPPYSRPSQKYWGDIIPPFTATNGGTFDGLNWHWGDLAETGSNLDKTEFRAINAVTSALAGTEQFEIDALEACQAAAADKSMKQLYDIERRDGGKSKKEILDELAEDFDPGTKDDVTDELPPGEGPKKEPTNVPNQSLSGNVWLDLNSNGYQEANEPNMPNIKVTVAKTDPNLAGRLVNRFKNTGGGKQVVAAVHWANQFPVFAALTNHVKGMLRTVTTYKVVTDKNGWYIFKSIGAGSWTAVGVVPDGLSVTYDSSALSDASVDATVPVSGHAHTWIGLVGPAGIKSKVKNPDGTPVTKTVTVRSAGADGKFCSKDDVLYEVTPVNGEIEIGGLSAGKYSIVKIGSTSTIGDFTVGNSTYTKAISTTKGTKCTAAQLADTGMEVTRDTYALIALALMMIATGVGVLRRKQNGAHSV